MKYVTAARGDLPLATYSPSSAASVDITGILTSAYEKYRIEFSLLPATDDVELWLRTDSNGGASFDSAANNYRYNELSSTNVLAVQDTEIVLAGGAAANGSVGNATGEGVAGTIIIHGLGSATLYPMITSHASAVCADALVRNMACSGIRESAAAIDAVQLLFESGNIASGTVRVYGIPN